MKSAAPRAVADVLLSAVPQLSDRLPEYHIRKAWRALVGPEMGALVITHYQRILDYIKPDFVHVFVDGRIVEEGGPELAQRLEAEGYEAFMPEPVGGEA